MPNAEGKNCLYLLEAPIRVCILARCLPKVPKLQNAVTQYEGTKHRNRQKRPNSRKDVDKREDVTQNLLGWTGNTAWICYTFRS